MADKKLLVYNPIKEKSQDKKRTDYSIERMSKRLGKFTEAVLDQLKIAEK